MKYKECPECGEPHLADEWQRGRKLRQRCHECGWVGEPRTPEKQRVSKVKTICASQFSGYCYEVFDQYGHAITSSRSYGRRDEALKAMFEDIERDERMPNVAPCRAVLWPATVKVRGQLFSRRKKK